MDPKQLHPEAVLENGATLVGGAILENSATLDMGAVFSLIIMFRVELFRTFWGQNSSTFESGTKIVSWVELHTIKRLQGPGVDPFWLHFFLSVYNWNNSKI